MKQTNLFVNISAIWSFVGKRRRWQFAGLFVLLLLTVFAEMVSLGAVVPFLTALTIPQMLLEASWFQPVGHFLGVQSAEALLLPMTLAFVTAALFSAGLRVLLLWVNTRLSASMSIQLRTALYKRALYSPYEFHLTNNSSNLITLVTQKAGTATHAAIMHLLLLAVAFVTSSAIILTLLMIDPIVALLAFGILGGGYILLGYVSRKMLKQNSHIIAENQPLAVKQLQEGIGGIRDVILDQSQQIFLNNYASYVRKAEVAQSHNSIIAQLPKFLLELIGIVLIAGLAFYLQMQGKAALPILGALALGSQRLLPSLQQAYFSWSTVVGAQAIIAEVADYLYVERGKHESSTKPIAFTQAIELDNVVFRYKGSQRDVLNGVSLTIPKGARVGFIGETGGGKSTLLDLVMGLLTPTFGKMYIDGVELNDNNRHEWQKHIAHVPQSIYLADASIAENIAYGVPKEQIDFIQIKGVAKQAYLEQFIESLPKGYDTFVGERGVQLSGGQRQRIGIARALYKKAEVIVFDEATSALDDNTESFVMEAIDQLNKNLTILTIAHRHNTLHSCDVIYKVFDGKVKD